jgi:predicted negative regulator of RcsB-dependent stress response
MSQKKVDRYKKYKNNKEKILKREKFMTRLEIAVACLIAVAFVGWFGWSVYDTVTKKGDDQAAEATEIDMNAYTNYVASLQSGYTS